MVLVYSCIILILFPSLKYKWDLMWNKISFKEKHKLLFFSSTYLTFHHTFRIFIYFNFSIKLVRIIVMLKYVMFGFQNFQYFSMSMFFFFLMYGSVHTSLIKLFNIYIIYVIG